MTGTLRAIALAPKKRAPMVEVDHATITREKGITGDARGHFPGRQVTVVFEDDWQAACDVLDKDLPWTTRRANLLVGGIDVPRRIGAQLRVGEVLLEVREETKPCGLMEKAVTGLKAALKPGWRGGVCCVVLEGGEIAPGDDVAVL
ncbi:hypothetical protein sos41_09800 [Alphaproteobacteria bacterium SO-S41]|nr:hypothetical protein sos41_09800 [Alphaproteobacteria bacterium SO-S41]